MCGEKKITKNISQIISYFSNCEHNHNHEITNGKIINTHTVEWNNSFSMHILHCTGLLSTQTNNTLSIPLNFICDDKTNSRTKIIFSIPISNLNIKEIMMTKRSGILEVSLKPNKITSMLTKITAIKNYRNMVKYKVLQIKNGYENDTEIYVTLIPGTYFYSMKYLTILIRLSTIIFGFIVAGLFCYYLCIVF